MGALDSISKQLTTQSNGPAFRQQTLVAGTDYSDVPFREVRVDAAGTAIFTDVKGTQITWNVLQGERIPFAFVSFDATSTATLIGLY